jgi:crotonobetainyl-CoA:carnitine CoA-transferase CaiB-like acyl-CoA transferase
VENQARTPFGSIKVVECGEGVSAAFGTKLLADLGAEVIKIESPAGDVTRRRGPFPTTSLTWKRAVYSSISTPTSAAW